MSPIQGSFIQNFVSYSFETKVIWNIRNMYKNKKYIISIILINFLLDYTVLVISNQWNIGGEELHLSLASSKQSFIY
jgi:hypothetical protein